MPMYKSLVMHHLYINPMPCLSDLNLKKLACQYLYSRLGMFYDDYDGNFGYDDDGIFDNDDDKNYKQTFKYHGI